MSNISGAPATLQLGDKEYKVYPLRDVDHEELNIWTRQEYLKRLRQVTDDPKYLEVAIAQSMRMTWAGSNMTSTVDGMTKLARCLCRDDKIDKVRIVDLLQTEEGVYRFWEAYDFAHGTLISKSIQNGRPSAGGDKKTQEATDPK